MIVDSAFLVEAVVFACAWWLGLYLLARNPAKALLRLTGLGLLAYALALASLALDALLPVLAPVQAGLLLLPALCWSGTLFELLAEDEPLRGPLLRAWRYGVLPLAAALFVLGGGSTSTWLALLVLAPLAVGGALVTGVLRRARPRRPLGVVLAATLFFGLGAGLLLFPAPWAPRVWLVPGVGVDLALLGFAIARLDALEEGEALLPDLLRSLAASALAAFVFGLQVLLAMQLATGDGAAMRVLLLATLAAAIAWQVWAAGLQRLLDRAVLGRAPQLRRALEAQRREAGALARVDSTLDLARLDEAEFARLTRRALSHYGDLARLASSPLTRLPAIEARLAARDAGGRPLERAAELKSLLAESIARLKPRGPEAFGVTDEWRYYNALYFPYVAGLKPYSRRGVDMPADAAARQAAEWFRRAVPERTLYNWQNAAALLIARDLRDRQPAGDPTARENGSVAATGSVFP
jgi:hypothetical protein